MISSERSLQISESGHAMRILQIISANAYLLVSFFFCNCTKNVSQTQLKEEKWLSLLNLPFRLFKSSYKTIAIFKSSLQLRSLQFSNYCSNIFAHMFCFLDFFFSFFVFALFRTRRNKYKPNSTNRCGQKKLRIKLFS